MRPIMNTKEYAAAVVGSAIRDARERRGWTRYKLAHEAGVQESHLAAIEKAKCCVRVDVLNKLCYALDLEIVFPLFTPDALCCG